MRTFLRVAAIAYGVYLAIALLLLTPALNLLPHRYVQDTYGRELRTGWVLFNPFTLSLEIRDAALDDDTGEPFLSFSAASINLSLQSIWQPGWVLDAVTLKDLALDIERLTPDEYNFSDLLGDDTEDAPPEPAGGPLPRVTIHTLDLHSSTIALTDRARETPYSTRWNGLHIQGKQISTVFEEARAFTVDAEIEGGGKLHLQGDVSLPLSNIAGHLSLADLNLHQVWLFAQPWLQLELREGRLALDGRYLVDWRDTVSYRIDEGHIGLSGINILPQSPETLPDTTVGINTLDINNIALDSSSHKVTIDAINLDGLAVSTWREGNLISLQRLFAANLPADAAGGDSTANDPGWTVELNTAQLRNGSLHWRSDITEPQVLDAHPVEATMEHITWPLSGESRFSLDLTVGEQTRATAFGALALAEGNGSIEYALEGLPLAWFNPTLPKPLKATITGGQVELKGRLALQDYTPTTIALGGIVRDFSARQLGVETTLTGWESVRFEELAVDMQQHTLALQKLVIDSYTGRLHINQDGSVNASKIWQAEVGEQARQIAEELTEDKPWTFSIPGIQISDSEIDFMDESLPIRFRTVIGDIEGEITDIGSAEDAAAKVNLKGAVDGYAPVTLTGKVAPFATPTDLDLKLTFDGVDMSLLSPYSASYAGYTIDQGLLKLRLKYTLKNNRLQGNNAVRIDKLKLGEKVDSDKAVDLPLKLALAILTDANGVIDMEVPVTGDVNKPGFDLSGVISRAFVNLIKKAVTAPFTLLASLAGSEEDLQRLAFASGSAALKDSTKEKLTELAAALAQRPQLSLVITGRLNLTADRERLQRNNLKDLLLADGLTAEEIKAKGPPWEEAIAERYEDLPASDEETGELSPREQYDVVVRGVEVPDKQLSELAQARAAAVKSFLLNEQGLAPDRAVIAQVSLDEGANTFSGVELGVGN